MNAHYVLIDYENVQPDLLPLLNRAHMRVIVFVGAAQKSIPFEFASAMQRLGSRATYVKLSGNGSNALDFHIAFYAGVLAARDPDAHIHIISKDTGFDPLIQHIQSRHWNTDRSKTICDIPCIAQQESFPVHPVVTELAPAASTSNGAHALPTHPAATSDRERTATPAPASVATAPAPVSNGNTPHSNSTVTATGNSSIPLRIEERVRFVAGRLTKHGKSRPARVETLRNHIHALFGKKLTDQEVDAIVIKMKRSNLLSIDENQRITYHLSG